MKALPLTQSQTGILIECLENPESTQYNLPFVTRLSRNIDSKRLCDAIKVVLRNDAAYYTRIVVVNESYCQYADTDMEIAIPIVPMEEDYVQACIHQFIRPFDLLNDCLTRIQIISTPTHLYLLIDMHHIINDGTSIMTVFDEIDSAYDGNGIQRHKKSIFEYAEYEESLLCGEKYEKAAAYYKGVFNGIEMSRLPMKLSDSPGACRQVSESLSHQFIDDFCRKYAIKPNLLFMSAMEIVLSRVTREDAVAYTTSYHGRNDKDYRNAIGMFVKTIPFTFSIDGAMDVLTFLHSHEERWNACRDNAVYPFTHFCRDLNQLPGIGFSFQSSVVNEQSLFLGENVLHEQYCEGTTIDSVVILVYGNTDDYEIRLRYADKQYPSFLMDAILTSMKECISQMIRQPMNKLQDISIINDAQQERLIQLGTGELLAYNHEATFVDMFRHQVERRPDAVAIVDAQGCISYGELDRRSDILAAKLQQLGVVKDNFVCLMLPRSLDFEVSILGVFKSGGAYTPLDSDYPNERLLYMLENSESRVLITTHALFEEKQRSGDFYAVNVLFIEDVDWSETVEPVNVSRPENLAYMIYTSGSTGKPKGVMVEHRSLCALSEWCIKLLQLTSSDHNAEHSSFSFDASVIDLFSPLAAGAQVHILPSSLRQDMDGIYHYIMNNGITGLTLSTQLGMEMLNAYDMPLRYLLMGGEKLELTKPSSVKAINGYGPTEFSVCSSFHVVDYNKEYKNIPIGRPVPNSSSFIVDKYGNLLPQGVAGELCLMGIQMARGYWKREDQTQKAFTPCPFIPEKMMYHTGDLARWNGDGELEYLGRIDSQVKLRGFRIEMGEIESCVITYSDAIKAVAAEVKEINGTQHLCLYYVSEDRINEDDLKSHMSETLTEYMVPDAFIRLEVMPLTPNGKINRKSLPVPELKAEEIVAPETELEQQLFAVAVKLLGHDQFGVTTNLIKVGMSSLLAMRLSVAIRQQLNLVVETKDILSTPTLRRLATVAKNVSTTDEYVWEKREYYPVTENQRGVYIDWELNRNTTQYNIPSVRELPDMDAKKLRDALIKVVDAHPYMKTRFEMKNEDLVQRRNDEEPAAVELHILDTKLDADSFQQRVRPFNLLADRLYRIEIYQTPSSVYLFTDFHHTIFDGLSSAVFMGDLQKAYGGELLQAETYSSYEHSLDEQQFMSGKEYEEAECYFDHLLDGVESLSYPQSQEVEDNASGAGIVKIEMDGSVIRNFCSEHGLTVNSYFLTTLLQVLHRVTRESRIQIISINNGRTDSRLSNAIGMFVKTLPVVSALNVKETTIAGLASEIQSQFQKTQSLDFYPFTKMVERHHLRSEIMYVYQGGLFENDAPENNTSLSDLHLDTVKFPLIVTCYPSGNNSYGVSLEYDKSLYSCKDMEILASMLKTVAKESSEVSLVKDISLVDTENKKKLLSLSKGESLDFDHDETIVDLFVRTAESTPDAVAVVFKDHQLTYGEIDRRTSELASYLQRHYGIGRGSVVGIMIDRSELMAIYPLAVMKAGGAYMPLDFKFPSERLQFMCKDAGVSLILSEGSLVKDTILDFAGEVFTSDMLCMLDGITALDSSHKAKSDDLMVVLYTSGSTGKPKGCLLEHHGIVNFCHWYTTEFSMTNADHVLGYANFGFDAHMIDQYPTYLSGASVYIIPSEMRMDIGQLNEYMEANRISIGFMTTQLGYVLITSFDNHSLRLLSVGGEKLTPIKKPPYRFYNVYGPTECSLFSTFYNIESDYDSSLIGRPLSGYQLLVADQFMRQVPAGVPGELIILGDGVARGYLNRPELNAEKFITIDGQRAYRSGDLVRWTENGNIDFLGRIDGQVKLRGLRIETGEVESVMSRYAHIKSVCVAVKEVGETQHLFGYYTSDGDIEDASLREFLGKSLTSFMIPEAFIRVDVMPLTFNGKIDRKSLPIPKFAEKEYVEPQTDLECYFCDMFADILKLEKVGATDHFFHIGGSSLIAMRAVAAFMKKGYSVTYSDLFNHPTPRSLALFVELMHSNKIETDNSTDVEVENYDYSILENILNNNNLNIYKKYKDNVQPIGTVLLTGATGYLGIHVLHELLSDESIPRIYCIVRNDKLQSAENRLRSLLFYYFDDTNEQLFGTRIFVIDGDITDETTIVKTEKLLNQTSLPITIINCAANVKHFSAGTDIEDVNIGGVKKCIDLCLHIGARLIHASTYSIGGCTVNSRHVAPHLLKENELYFGQNLSNKYAHSKFIAERIVLEAVIKKGLNGKIMRLGNLSSRSTDGEFQINFHTNSFMGRLKAYQMLGCVPYSILDMPIEFSPINEVAKAMVMLSKTPRECVVFHPCNMHHQLLTDVFDCLGNMGYNLRKVEDEEFEQVISTALEDVNKSEILQSLLAYKTVSENGEMIIFNGVDLEYSAQVLYRLNFNWSITTWDYIQKFARKIQGLGLFDDNYIR